MLKRVRERISYANVMATIAVFIALGGVATGEIGGDRTPLGKSTLHDIKVVEGETPSDAFTQDGATEVKCPGSRRVLGGGGYVRGSPPATGSVLYASFPASHTSWRVAGTDTNGGGGPFGLKVSAICAKTK
jgi:hypothetical protein